MPLDIEPIRYWINERHAIYLRKAVLQKSNIAHIGGYAWESREERDAWGGKGLDPRQWRPERLTNDPILREYRFCNVFRELDRVTVWIRENIREPFADHQHLWFMLAAARYINWPDTLDELISGGDTWPSDVSGRFSPERMTWQLEDRRARGLKVETGAYMIRAESDTKAPWYNWSKQRYVAEVVLGKLWERRAGWVHVLDGKLDAAVQAFGGSDLRPTMQLIWEMFQDKHYTGWGPFMAYQVVVDLRWTRYLRDAPDIQTWSALGPGSRRGLNRLHGRPVGFALSQDQGLREMIELRERLSAPGVLAPWVPLPDLSDVQNALCETDKYLRVKSGEGRPRAKYVPGRGY